MRLDFVTIFPNMIAPLLAEGVIARGVKQGLLDVRVWDLRDYATDRHRSTDDEAYGGGPGMVMLAEPVFRCVDHIRGEGRGARGEEDQTRGEGLAARGEGEQTAPPSAVPSPIDLSSDPAPSPTELSSDTSPAPLDVSLHPSPLAPRPSPLSAAPPAPHLVMTSPQGRRFDQGVARELLEKQHVVFLCGRYEGFDHRVHEQLQPDEISVGDFVVSGGELPAMLMADAIGRLVPGVVGNTGSVEEDSFFRGLLDYPHYTRPVELRGMRIPDILLSGHHENIRKWRKEQALRATLAKRPDLLETAGLDDEAREILRSLRKF